MARRRISECPHLESDPPCCAVVADSGGFAPGEARVSSQRCQACCEFPVPASAVDNTVTASLLYELSIDQLQVEIDPTRRCDLLMTREFALQGIGWAGSARPAERRGLALSSRTNSSPVHAVSRPDGPIIGLIGFNSATGLGYANRDFARELNVVQWLVVDHPGHETLPAPELRSRIDHVAEGDLEFLRDWVHGLDWLLFIESPVFECLPQMAHEAGVQVACVPNHEWFCPVTSNWLDHVDLLLCPVKSTAELTADWARRFSGSWRTSVFPWPVDLDRFEFVERSVCQEFLFVNGQGGTQAAYEDGSLTAYRRKGLELVLEAARLVPQIPILLTTQSPLPPGLPGNIELLPDVSDNRQLYVHGDVCLQPSHWEGTGLPLLECQAAGMPLVTTAAAPMNEFQALRHVPVSYFETVVLTGRRFFPSACMSPDSLAAVLRDLHGQEIQQASRAAREFIETEHSWRRARQIIHNELAMA